ncbi:MAG: M13 family metallopeptidase [Parvularculaceae bacterium]|nr:M13 family metallopeptidase [Parvularculaceae bacterium]
MRKNGLKLGVGPMALSALALVAGCGKTGTADETPAKVEAPKAEYGSWGVDTTQGDPATRPGDDFARYANGKWLDTFEIPADLPGFVSFTKLRLDAEADVKAIIEELAAKKSAPGSLEQKVGGFFKTFMDVEKLDALGAAPLKPHLDRIYGIQSKDDLMRAYAEYNVHGVAPVGVGILPDPADTTRYIAFVGQSGLGLPDRDYYLKREDKFVQYRAAYKDFIAKMLTLAGIADGAAKADAILALETKVAEVHWSQEDSRDIQKIYNPMNLDQLQALAPEFNWALIMDELKLSAAPTILVAQTTAIDKEAEIFAAADMNLLKDWLAFHFIRTHAQYLASSFDKANFEFYGKTLRGVPEQRERWKRGVNEIDASLGEAVGKIYVDRHFPPQNKSAMDALVKNLVAAFEERLKANDWMDEATRAQALAKLATFEPRIGYTTKWTDYSSLEIGDDLLQNSVNLADFLWRDQVSRLGGPVDRERWDYPPQTVNASYNPLMNQITFPAGILQPPFFDLAADPAVNYGAIGAVIGHEIGHGFDDQGRRFDEKGRIRDWWSPASNDAFQKKADALGAQYDGYKPLPDASISGKLTMGENIGDLGGIQMAYAAYHRYLDECCGGEAPVIDGLTGDQRFFLSWAQVWRGKYREDEQRQRLETDPHSPPYYRINGVVRNVDAWYDAFGVTAEDDLYLPPEQRVRIW